MSRHRQRTGDRSCPRSRARRHGVSERLLQVSNTERNVLEDISFSVKPGWMVALVGRSGAGKTTVQLGFTILCTDGGGVIRLDNQSLADINWKSYRRLLGVVEQDVFFVRWHRARQTSLMDVAVHQTRGCRRSPSSRSAEFIEAFAAELRYMDR